MNSQNQNMGGGSSTDTLVVFGLCIVAFFGFFWGFWHFGNISIIKVTRILFGILELPFWYFQMLLNKGLGLDASFMNFTTNTIGKLCYPDKNHLFNPLMNCTVDLKAVSFEYYYKNNAFGSILIGGCYAAYVWIKHNHNLKYHPDQRFTKEHDLDSLIKELGSTTQPHLRYFSYFIPSNVPTDTGFYRFMSSPRDFVLEQKLVSGFRKYEIETVADFNENSNFGSSPKDEVYPILDEKKFEICMIQQLGQVIQDVKDLSDGELILYSIFLPMACATDENMSEKEFKHTIRQKDVLLDYFWAVAYKQLTKDKKFINPNNLKPRNFNYFDRSKLERTVSKYWNHPVAREVFGSHAYARTALIALIYKARMLGVLAPCELRWLRMYDRNLWALVQNVSRPSVFVEQLAAFSHYTSECYHKRKKISPDFSYGWLGLCEALKSYKYSNPSIYLKKETNVKKL